MAPPALGGATAVEPKSSTQDTPQEVPVARPIGPDEASRKAEVVDPATQYFRAKRNKPATFYTDAQATQLADIVTLDGAVIAGSTVTTDAYSMIPLFRFPDGVDTLYVVCDNGPVWPVYARTDDRLDALSGRVGTVEATTGAAETAAGAQAKADAAQAASAQRAANLADLANAATARTNLGLGNAATRDVGTTAGTVAAGDDPRVAAAVTGEVLAADGSVGYSPLWKHARVSPSPLDRVPVIAPTLSSEGVFCQEPQVWLYADTIHMFYTSGSPASLHYATCPANADPLVPANWTKAGRVLGSGVGGAAGTVQHPGIYIEGSTLYVYYVDNVGSVLSVATAPLSTPTNFTLGGTVLTMPAGAGAPLANPFIMKVGSTYRLYFEANTVLPLWQIGMATGSAPDALFANPVFPLSGLSVDPGFSSNSNPFIIAEDGGYTMWFHGARGRYQRGSGSPTVGFLATSADGITWTVAAGGQPTVRLAHPLEVNQVADFSLLDVGAEKYAFWSANSTNNNTTNTGQIMVSRAVRPVVVKVGGESRVISGSSAPTGPIAPWPWLSSSQLAADFTTTTVGSDVRIAGLSNQNVIIPDTVRGIANVTLNLKTSAVGNLVVKCVMSGAVLLGGKATVSAIMDAVPANQTVTIHLSAVFEVPTGKTFSQDWYVSNSAGSATTTVLAGSSSFLDTRKLP